MFFIATNNDCILACKNSGVFLFLSNLYHVRLNEDTALYYYTKSPKLNVVHPGFY